MIRRRLVELRNDTKGSPALEFALIAPLFFVAIFATFELGRTLYERNQLAAAAAVAMRAVAMDNDATDSQITAAIKNEMKKMDTTKVSVSVCNKTVASQVFKQISVTYSHDMLVKVGKYFSGFTLKATRYAPAVNGAGNGSACATPP